MSFGNVTQTIDLSGSSLALILGLNKDAISNGEDGIGTGNRNGVGKSTIVHALCYALYGKTINNKISMSRVVNNINKKGCVVSLTFEQGGVEYKIERGRGPTYFKLTCAGKEKNDDNTDETNGESGDTQKYLDNIIGMSQNMFQSIVVFSATSTHFLAEGAAKQREFIEELLGLNQLSHKADILKNKIKLNTKLLDQEQLTINMHLQFNQKTTKQIDDAIASRRTYLEAIAKQIADHENFINSVNLEQLAIEIETINKNNGITDAINRKKQLSNELASAVAQHQEWGRSNTHHQQYIFEQITSLKTVDLDTEIANHQSNEQIRYRLVDLNGLHASVKDKQKTASQIKSQIDVDNKIKIQKQTALVNEMNNDKCPTCGSAVDSTKHEKVLTQMAQAVIEVEDRVTANQAQLDQINNEIHELNVRINDIGVLVQNDTTFKTLTEAMSLSNKISQLEAELRSVESATSPYGLNVAYLESQIAGITIDEIKPTRYNSVSAVEQVIYKYQNSVNELEKLRSNNSDPYISQIESLKSSIYEISYTELDRLKKLIEHQEFLVKVLTDKNSFVRKKLIEQNTAYLNTQLKKYLDASGSQFNVQFNSDLSVGIESFGIEYDFEQLSRGEKNRVMVPLNLAFRDVYESLYGNINLLIVDELLDNGLDPVGIYNAFDMLYDLSALGRNVFVISHREELTNKASEVLLVTKEDRFSTISRLEE